MLSNRNSHLDRQRECEELAKAALAGCTCFHGRNLSVETEGAYLILRGVVKTAFQREQVCRIVKKAVGLVPLLNEIEIAVE
jgi:osmotically-inducible protein OsmY